MHRGSLHHVGAISRRLLANNCTELHLYEFVLIIALLINPTYQSHGVNDYPTLQQCIDISTMEQNGLGQEGTSGEAIDHIGEGKKTISDGCSTMVAKSVRIGLDGWWQ